MGYYMAGYARQFGAFTDQTGHNVLLCHLPNLLRFQAESCIFFGVFAT